MTDIPSPPNDSWDALLATLRRRYPGQKNSVLFCIHKLQQNPDLTIRDFRDEADLYGIPLAGRSLHSARTLLGLIKEAAPTPVAAPRPAMSERALARQQRRTAAADEDSVEDKVIAAVRSIQSAAADESVRLRQAIRDAVGILLRAVGDA